MLRLADGQIDRAQPGWRRDAGEQLAQSFERVRLQKRELRVQIMWCESGMSNRKYT
jgi:hypothetical protein